MLTCFSTQAHFLYLFHFLLERKFSLHASELHKTKFQPLSALLFTSFLSEQTVDTAVVCKLQVTSYSVITAEPNTELREYFYLSCLEDKPIGRW